MAELQEMEEADLLEIYCGNGNFSLPAADSCRRVLATEMKQESIAGAEACAKKASLQNVVFRKCRAEVMNLQHLREIGPTGPYDFKTLLLDPPRAGLSDESRQMVSHFDRAIYISCNPHTLARDLAMMESHGIEKACFFDQFPWTDHAEVALHLLRR